MQKKKVLLRVLFGAAAVCVALAGWLIADNFIDHSGWILRDGSYQCLDFSGDPLTGLQTLEGVTYFFDDAGRMCTGWQDIDGSRYYFGADGAMQRGRFTIGEDRYFFGTDGRMLTGWVASEGRRYFCGEDGAAVTGWLSREDGVWYLDQDGAAVTGQTEIEGLPCLFGDDGRQVIGWADTATGRFYYLEGGGVATGWQDIDGRRFYFTESGTPMTGWFTEGEYTYYLTEQGAAVGPTKIDDRIYYFTPMGINVLLVNAWHKIPDDYNPTIVDFVDYHRIVDYVKQPLERMFADMEAAEIKYTLNSIYRTNSQQREILRLRTQEYEDRGYGYNQAYAKARQTVALPGTSEHELGLAADILGKEANAWLAQHCWEYGFILRYPGEKAAITGIVNESWHFRYVGTEVSMDMKDTGLCLEEYLGAASTIQQGDQK